MPMRPSRYSERDDRLSATVMVERTDDCYTPAHKCTAVVPLREQLFSAI